MSEYNALSEELSEELRNLYLRKRIQQIRFIMFEKNTKTSSDTYKSKCLTSLEIRYSYCNNIPETEN